ncbi:MAG TPA: hypothetical protein VEI46_09290 [Thermodesulfovibrionales bacterium]|nr:hypothetical protein [Thermodesulfovibrionales bacterium]
MGLFSPIGHCPSCGKEEVLPSRARSNEQGLLWSLGVLRYFRCHTCGWREARISVSKKRLLKALVMTVLIALTTIVISLVIINIFSAPTPAKRGKSRSEMTIPAPQDTHFS